MPITIHNLQFEPIEFGWAARLGNEWPTFFGRPFLIAVHTLDVKVKKGVPPEPNEAQKELLRYLLDRFADVSFACSRAFNENCDRDILAKLDVAEVFIRTDSERDDGQDWTLVLESTQDEDDGYDLDFQGTKLVDAYHYGDLE